MNEYKLVRNVFERIKADSQPAGAAEARNRLEEYLKRLAGSIDDNPPDSAVGWLALIKYGADRAAVARLCENAQQSGQAAYMRFQERFEV